MIEKIFLKYLFIPSRGEVFSALDFASKVAGSIRSRDFFNMTSTLQSSRKKNKSHRSAESGDFLGNSGFSLQRKRTGVGREKVGPQE